MEPYEGGISGECALCGGEIYAGETYYAINAQTICRDCLPELAAQFFAPFQRKEGSRWANTQRGSAI